MPSCDEVLAKALEPAGRAVGIDIAVAGLATTSTTSPGANRT